MTWDEIKDKYRRVALHVLGIEAPEEEVQNFMYKQILYKSCATNGIIDSIACDEWQRNQNKSAPLAGVAVAVPVSSPALPRRLGLLHDVENIITRLSFWIANKFGSYTEMRELVGAALADNVERALKRFYRVLVAADEYIFSRFPFKKQQDSEGSANLLSVVRKGIDTAGTGNTTGSFKSSHRDEHIEAGS
jgi:hypothetical protein